MASPLKRLRRTDARLSLEVCWSTYRSRPYLITDAHQAIRDAIERVASAADWQVTSIALQLDAITIWLHVTPDVSPLGVVDAFKREIHRAVFPVLALPKGTTLFPRSSFVRSTAGFGGTAAAGHFIQRERGAHS
jgi:REP element-mobilizing transposase RayT